jgi:hypothetical protein
MSASNCGCAYQLSGTVLMSNKFLTIGLFDPQNWEVR